MWIFKWFFFFSCKLWPLGSWGDSFQLHFDCSYIFITGFWAPSPLIFTNHPHIWLNSYQALCWPSLPPSQLKQRGVCHFLCAGRLVQLPSRPARSGKCGCWFALSLCFQWECKSSTLLGPVDTSSAGQFCYCTHSASGHQWCVTAPPSTHLTDAREGGGEYWRLAWPHLPKPHTSVWDGCYLGLGMKCPSQAPMLSSWTPGADFRGCGTLGDSVSLERPTSCLCWVEDGEAVHLAS